VVQDELSGSSGGPRHLLVRLERGFCLALLVLLALAALGQAALFTARGREHLSRVDRLEGTRLKVVEPGHPGPGPSFP